MMYRKIVESIFSHKRTHKSIKRLDKVGTPPIIACRLSPVACRLDHTQNTTTQLSSRMASVPKGFSFQVRFFILAHIFMKDDYYEKK